MAAHQYIEEIHNFNSRNILVEGMADGSDNQRTIPSASDDQISLAAIHFEQNEEPMRT